MERKKSAQFRKSFKPELHFHKKQTEKEYKNIGSFTYCSIFCQTMKPIKIWNSNLHYFSQEPIRQNYETIKLNRFQHKIHQNSKNENRKTQPRTDSSSQYQYHQTVPITKQTETRNHRIQLMSKLQIKKIIIIIKKAKKGKFFNLPRETNRKTLNSRDTKTTEQFTQNQKKKKSNSFERERERPALAKRRVGSLRGTTGLDLQSTWPFPSKNSMNVSLTRLAGHSTSRDPIGARNGVVEEEEQRKQNDVVQKRGGAK